MSSMKLITKLSTYLLGKTITNNGVMTSLSTRGFVIVPTRPMQSKKEDDEADACAKTKEAADAVKDGAKEVRQTCEFMRDTVETTAKSMNKMAKETTEKVTETAETLTNKTKGTVSGAWGMAKNTTEIIKDKVMGK
ncbi:hypothetical protein ACFX15_012529 [Malus domestica]|uniref:uncharacterized protein LOC126597026 n=1 Tax=Malus sylvestris TaxID=3752 RepID=UPI0010AA9FC7|nr:uncharacterized protein LOC103453660 [Malus domestica]XP_050119736.1 uncharacterized protein LOC126597026 [Malus sylvestris]